MRFCYQSLLPTKGQNKTFFKFVNYRIKNSKVYLLSLLRSLFNQYNSVAQLVSHMPLKQWIMGSNLTHADFFLSLLQGIQSNFLI